MALGLDGVPECSWLRWKSSGRWRGRDEALLCKRAGFKDIVYYPDEEICRNELFQNLLWVKKQREIAELGLGPEISLFTVNPLKAIKTASVFHSAAPGYIMRPAPCV